MLWVIDLMNGTRVIGHNASGDPDPKPGVLCRLRGVLEVRMALQDAFQSGAISVVLSLVGYALDYECVPVGVSRPPAGMEDAYIDAKTATNGLAAFVERKFRAEWGFGPLAVRRP
jgi:hypothetical protein